MSLKLLSLNIEGDNHLDTVISLVREEDPDLICFHEVFEADVPLLKHSFDMEDVFVPAEVILEANNFRLSPKGNLGTLILSKLPILSTHTNYYDGDPDKLPELTNQNGNAANRFLLWVEVEKDQQLFRIVTTHFTIINGGQVSDLQRHNMKKILNFLEGKEFVLCGDFNAPRGREIFNLLAAKYVDGIPGKVKTTLDRNLHRSGNTSDFPDFVVDGLFTSPGFEAHETRVVCGVSDHCAVISNLSAL